jgi:hypothetical protein
MLGEHAQDFLTCNQEQSPIRESDGVFWTAGNKKYAAATDASIVVADSPRNTLYVWLLVAGQPAEFYENDKLIPLPKPVREAIQAHAPQP